MRVNPSLTVVSNAVSSTVTSWHFHVILITLKLLEANQTCQKCPSRWLLLRCCAVYREGKIFSGWRGIYRWEVWTLQGVIAVNSFICVFNSEGRSESPFCGRKETVFHTFMNCTRLKTLFTGLESRFHMFDENFSLDVFILGSRYSQKQRDKCQLFHFIVGQTITGHIPESQE